MHTKSPPSDPEVLGPCAGWPGPLLTPSGNSAEVKNPFDHRNTRSLDPVVDREDLLQQEGRQRHRPVVAQPGIPETLVQVEHLLDDAARNKLVGRPAPRASSLRSRWPDRGQGMIRPCYREANAAGPSESPFFPLARVRPPYRSRLIRSCFGRSDEWHVDYHESFDHIEFDLLSRLCQAVVVFRPPFRHAWLKTVGTIRDAVRGDSV
jgi:hypothetical protein